jgi:hypothetical protein
VGQVKSRHHQEVQFNMTTACEEDGVYKGSVPKGFIDVTFDPTEVYPLFNPLDDSVLDPVGGSHFMAQAQLYSLLQYKLGKV